MPISKRFHQNCPTCTCPEPTLRESSRDLSETKYKIVMRMAERWAMEAFQTHEEPHDYCSKKFLKLRPCEEWSEVTRVILTAFVIREHLVITDFLTDSRDNQ